MRTLAQAKQSIIHELTIGREKNGDRKCLDHSLRGQKLWTLWEYTNNNGEVMKTITLDLISLQGHYWSNKTIDIDMGPYHFNCPKKFVKALSESDWNKHNACAKNWAKMVLDNQ